jgi:hypothetical protein
MRLADFPSLTGLSLRVNKAHEGGSTIRREMVSSLVDFPPLFQISRHFFKFPPTYPSELESQQTHEHGRHNQKRLVGFGRTCAPVRYAHPSFWAHKHAKRALRAPAHRSFAAPPKYKTISRKKCFPSFHNFGCQGRLSFHWAKLHPTELHCALLS